jgi:ornithine carbamoyltransferase
LSTIVTRNLLNLSDLDAIEIDRIFAITQDLKAKYAQGLREPLLPGRVMALLFEKPSLRTRVSFEAGMIHLGGSSLFLGDDVGFGARESMADFGRVLSQYVDLVVVRAFQHQKLLDLARYCTCPVINGLTDEAHPCQALSDLYTLKEIFGRLKGRTLAYIGDGNNVACSLAEGCAKVGMRFYMATPEAYRFRKSFLDQLSRNSPQLDLEVTTEPAEAVGEASAVYTDVWTSMGQEAESTKRKNDFAHFQVNLALMRRAPKEAVFLHCLPAHRGEEVTDEVIDGPQSVVVQQAANRLHVQKGILAWILR